MLTEPAPQAKEIRDACRSLLRDLSPAEVVRGGHDPSLWKRIVEAGWTGVGLGESAGGAGLGIVAQATMFTEVGRALAPVPLLGTARAATLLAAAGADQLPAVLDGSIPAALVVDRSVSPLGTARVSATHADGALRLDGRAAAVLDGAAAQAYVVVAAGPDGPVVAWLARDAAGLRVRDVDTADVSRPLADLEFAGCAAHPVAAEAAALRTALAVAAVSFAAEMVGTADRALELTLEYLKTRHQFGRPIGGFQALKHRCADLATELTLARELVFACAEILDGPGEDGALDALVAATVHRAGAVVSRIGAEAVQLHGAIGFTEEHDIGLYYRRSLADAAVLPAPVTQLNRLADALGA